MRKTLFLLAISFLLISGCSSVSNDKNVIAPIDNSSVSNTKPKPSTFTVLDPLPATDADKILDLSRKSLTKVDMSVFDKTGLEELNLSFNGLTGALPSQLGKLKDLRVLNASNNKMTGVPAEIGQLQNLEVLDLSNNQLTGLPNELANLKNLKTLNLSGNQYSEQDLDIIRNSLPKVEYILK